ncbi:MAG: TolC family protein [Nitrospiraceae bacterium]|nr:TolC family protein [Nitrospiraceae bacterium]
MRRNVLLVVLCLTVATGAVAATAPLTIGAAVKTALEHNPAVRSASKAAQADAANARRAKGFRLPSVDLMEMYDRTNNPAEAFGFQLNQKRFSLQDFAMVDPNNPSEMTTWLTSVQLVQPVYTGGKLSARIHQADFMAHAGRLTHSHAEERVAFDAVTAYTNLAKAREYLNVITKARDTTARHVKLAEQYAAQGMIVKAEVLKAKVFLAHMNELVEQASSGAELAEAALNFQMGLDQSVHHELAPFPPAPPVTGNLQSWVNRALGHRRDLGSAKAKLDAGRLEEKVATAGFLPQVALIGRYDWYDNAFAGNHGNSGAIMAVAKLNLFRGGADRAARASAKFRTASFESNIHRFQEGIRLQVRQAWQELLTARARHETSKAALASAREALRVREARFKQGLDKMIDLLDAETQLRQAEVSELVSRYDVALATYRLYFNSGTSIVALETSSEAH